LFKTKYKPGRACRDIGLFTEQLLTKTQPKENKHNKYISAMGVRNAHGKKVNKIITKIMINPN
jgi:hypothetical protein